MSGVNGAVRIATGKRPKPSPRECEFIGECYTAWFGLAVHNGLAKLRCSEATFNAHLNYGPLICGPWQWEIDNGIRYGTVQMVRRDKTKIGEMTVSDLIIH